MAESVRAALEGSILDGEVGVPGPVGNETPRARGGFREERIALPVFFQPAADHEATLLVAHVASKPSFRNPDDPFGFTFSDTNARTWQARGADTWKTGPHRIAAFASWERWQVDNRNTFGATLSGNRSTLWGGGLQDSIALPGDEMGGVRGIDRVDLVDAARIFLADALEHALGAAALDAHGDTGNAASKDLAIFSASGRSIEV